jgi:hypothetical protein
MVDLQGLPQFQPFNSALVRFAFFVIVDAAQQQISVIFP